MGKRKRRISPGYSNQGPKKAKVTSVDMAVKQGSPTDDELEELGNKIGEKWIQLGRRLGFKGAKLQGIEQRHRPLSERGYHMLMDWKEKYGSAATYQTLDVALQHKLVQRKDLAEKICYKNDVSSEEESCKHDEPSESRRRRLAGDNQSSSSAFASQEYTEHGNIEDPLNVEKCKDHLKSHYDTFSKVKIVPWDNSSSIQIEEIYTPLHWVRYHRTPREVTKVELGDYTNMFQKNGYHGNPRRMLVYGPPGIGKSTFCKKVAYDWSKALKEILKNFHILLLIKLQDVCDLKDIRDVLNASKLLARDCPISYDSLYDYIVNHQDKVILILDGFDEYSCAKEHSPILEIWRGEQLRDCHVIVTTRYLEGNELSGLSCIQFEIQGFKGWKGIRTYAKKFLAGEKDVEEFKSYLKEKGLKDMAEIPLLLLMLCVLWKEKHHEGLPTSRSDIYTEFIQTMLNHKVEKEKSGRFQKVTSKEAREDLSNLGKVAFDALLQGHLFVRCSNLPDSISRTIEKLREVGLFQIVNTTSLNPEKAAYFIHKSVQEFLAAWHMKEEVLSVKGDSMTSLSRLESVEKILKVIEVLKFVCELSTEAACTVFHHVGCVGEEEFSLDSESSVPIQSTEQLSLELQSYLTLMSHSYFCCSPEKRQNLYSMFLSYTGDIMLLDSNQVNIASEEHLLKSTVAPMYIFFSDVDKYSEQGYQDLITVAEDLKAIVVSSAGEKEAADFLRRHASRPLDEFFFKRKRKMSLNVLKIQKLPYIFPTEILRELISSTAESTQGEGIGDQLSEQVNTTPLCSTEDTDSITDPTPHSLSWVWNIECDDMEWEEIRTLVDSLPLIISPCKVIMNEFFVTTDTQLMETLVSCFKFTDTLDMFIFHYTNLTAKPAAAIARSLHQASNLHYLNLSGNPLGEGVSVLIQHLSSCPSLKRLHLTNVKMTKKQIDDLSAAVHESNITWLSTDYHDEDGNVKAEDEWPTHDSDDELEFGSVIDSEEDQESESVADSDDKLESESVADSDDK